MKKVIWAIVILALLGGGIYYYLRYREIQKDPYETFIVPRLEYSSFVFKTIKPEYVTMDMNMLIDNPTLIGLAVDSFTYDFYIADYRVFNSTYPEAINLEAGDSSFITIPVTMYNDSLNFVLDSLKKAGVEDAEYRVKGNYYLDVPIFDERKFSYDRTFTAPLYKIPITTIADWDFKEFEDGNALLTFTLKVVNLNVFPYEFKDLSYRIILGEDEKVFTGNKPGQVNIGSEDTAYIELPVEVDIGQFGGALLEYLFKGDDLTYNFYSRLVVVSDGKPMKDSPMELYSVGTLGSIKEFMNASKK